MLPKSTHHVKINVPEVVVKVVSSVSPESVEKCVGVSSSESGQMVSEKWNDYNVMYNVKSYKKNQ